MSNLLRRRAALLGAGDNTDWKSLFCSMIDGSISGEIVIPSEVTVICDNCFYGMTGITAVVIPSGVTSIGASAFRSCTSLVSVTIPDSVTTLKNYAFIGCSALLDITIPSGITNLGQQTFQNCGSLQWMELKATTPPTIYSNTFNAATTCLFYVPDSAVNTYKAANNWSAYASRIYSINDKP